MPSLIGNSSLGDCRLVSVLKIVQRCDDLIIRCPLQASVLEAWSPTGDGILGTGLTLA
jgi:hypothetical protein